MNKELKLLLEKVGSVPDFMGVEFSTVNDTNAFGDNALHCVCVWGDIDAAKLLIDNGIYINQQGEGGLTPLNIADEFNHFKLVNYLIDNGADESVLGAEFKYDDEKNRQHMENLQKGIDGLEGEIKNKCDDA